VRSIGWSPGWASLRRVDDTRFWELIDEARDDTAPTAPAAEPGGLSDVLDELSDAELLAFHRMFAAQLARLNDWKVWGAGYVAAQGMGDDSFDYFRAWLVGKGEDAVKTALTAPDDLVDFLSDHAEEFDGELLEYVALDLIESRGLQPEPIEREADDDADGAPAGEEWDEDDVDAMYPRLHAWALGEND
jgi:hypothetical protein